MLLSALGVSLALAIVRSLLSGLQNLTDFTVSHSLPGRRQWPGRRTGPYWGPQALVVLGVIVLADHVLLPRNAGYQP